MSLYSILDAPVAPRSKVVLIHESKTVLSQLVDNRAQVIPIMSKPV